MRLRELFHRRYSTEVWTVQEGGMRFALLGGWYEWRLIEGIVVPRWLGIAAEPWEWRGVLLLPIPLNMLYAWTARAYYWLRNGLRNPYREAYRQGRLQGWTEMQGEIDELRRRLGEQ